MRVKGIHSFIMNQAESIAAIIDFLERKSFRRLAAES